MNFKFEKFDNYIIADIDGQRCLIDTGSPNTIGRRGRIRLFLGGESHPSQDNCNMGAASIDSLSQSVGGAGIDFLVGGDVLGKHCVTIDWEAGTIGLDDDESHINTGGKMGQLLLPMQLVMGVPIINVKIAGERVKAFFDTGAKISYVSRELVGNSPVVGSVSDFYPGLGNFTSELHELTASLVDETVTTLHFGKLPATLDCQLSGIGASSIIGNDIFAAAYPRIEIDYPKQELVIYKK